MTIINPMRTTLPTNALERDLVEAQVETAESHNAKLTGKAEPIPVPFPFPPVSPLTRDINEENAKAALRNAAATVETLAKNSQVVAELEKAGVEIDPDALKEISGLKGPDDVFHMGSRFSFSGSTVLARNSDEWTTFGFPERVQSIQSLPNGLEVFLENGAVHMIMGGPTFASLFQIVLIPEAPKSTLDRDPDLREFKKQVVAAFKHFGLDTKAFFGV